MLDYFQFFGTAKVSGDTGGTGAERVRDFEDKGNIEVSDDAIKQRLVNIK